MVCQYCGKEISALRQLRDQDFCSKAHRIEHQARLRKALSDLAAPEPTPTRIAGFMPDYCPAPGNQASQQWILFIHSDLTPSLPAGWGVSIGDLLQSGVSTQFPGGDLPAASTYPTTALDCPAIPSSLGTLAIAFPPLAIAMGPGLPHGTASIPGPVPPAAGERVTARVLESAAAPVPVLHGLAVELPAGLAPAPETGCRSLPVTAAEPVARFGAGAAATKWQPAPVSLSRPGMRLGVVEDEPPAAGPTVLTSAIPAAVAPQAALAGWATPLPALALPVAARTVAATLTASGPVVAVGEIPALAPAAPALPAHWQRLPETLSLPGLPLNLVCEAGPAGEFAVLPMATVPPLALAPPAPPADWQRLPEMPSLPGLPLNLACEAGPAGDFAVLPMAAVPPLTLALATHAPQADWQRLPEMLTLPGLLRDLAREVEPGTKIAESGASPAAATELAALPLSAALPLAPAAAAAGPAAMAEAGATPPSARPAQEPSLELAAFVPASWDAYSGQSSPVLADALPLAAPDLRRPESGWHEAAVAGPGLAPPLPFPLPAMVLLPETAGPYPPILAARPVQPQVAFAAAAIAATVGSGLAAPLAPAVAVVAGRAVPRTAAETRVSRRFQLPTPLADLATPPEPHAADIMPGNSAGAIRAEDERIAPPGGPIKLAIQPARLPDAEPPAHLGEWLQPAALSVPTPFAGHQDRQEGEAWIAGRSGLRHPSTVTPPLDTRAMGTLLPVGPEAARPPAQVATTTPHGFVELGTPVSAPRSEATVERVDVNAGPSPACTTTAAIAHPMEPPAPRWTPMAEAISIPAREVAPPAIPAPVLGSGTPHLAEVWPSEYYVQRGRLQFSSHNEVLPPRADTRLPQFRVRAILVPLESLIRKEPTAAEAAQKGEKRSILQWEPPAWARGLAAGIALCAFLWVGSSALRRGPNPEGTGATVAMNVTPGKKPDGVVQRVKRAIAGRAMLELADGLHSGKQFWDGSKPDWGKGWQRHPDGYVRPGALALFTPSLQLTDYRMEFLTQIEEKSVGWAFRAHDVRNYYAMKFHVVAPGLRPVISVVRYPVVNGKRGRQVEIPLQVMMHNNQPFRVAVEVRGNQFITSVDGETVDRWSDDELALGGVGFFSDAGERARLYWVKVTNNDDLLGRICAYMAGKRTAAAGGDERAFTTGWADPGSGMPVLRLTVVAWIGPRPRFAGSYFYNEVKRG